MANYAVSNTFSPLTFISSTLVGILVLTGGPILNESSDLLEDTKYGVKSFSTLLTWKRKIQLMILGILLLSTLMPIIQLLFGVHLIVPIISVGLNIVLLRFLFPVMGQYEETRVNKARKIAKLIFFFIPISFIIVSL